MKRIITLLFAVIIMGQAFADDFQSGNLYYHITSENTAEVSFQYWHSANNYSGLTTAFIPETVSNNDKIYSVTGIREAAFYYCSSLTSIDIPNSVTNIGNYAFYGCSNLKSIVIPNSVTNIAENAFSGCNSLNFNEFDNAYYIGNSDNPYMMLVKAKNDIESCEINNNCKILHSGAFQFCYNLTSVTIPNSVTSIPEDAFYYCQELSSVTIPNSVASIGERAFYYCYNLAPLTIPNSVASIDDYAFDGVKIIIYSGGANEQNKPWGAKKVCYPPDENGLLYTDIEHTQLVAYIGNGKNVVIPNGVISIGDNTFEGCSDITAITIPNSVTSIGNYAFSGCSGLTSVTIPESVVSIGNFAFNRCRKITSINVEAQNAKYTSEDGILFNKDKTQLLSFPSGKTGAYVVPNSVTSIEYYAFYGSSLTSIVIPNGITSFSCNSCDNLESVYLPESVLTIGITQCNSLTSVKIPNGAESISFWGCNSLTSVDIPNSVTYFYFGQCSSLTSIVIPDSATSIGQSAFFGCSNLTSVTIGESISNIGENAFAGCDSLKSIICKGLIPPKVSNDRLTDNIINDAELYMKVTLSCPKNAKLYRTLQPWCNFDLADDTNTGHIVDTIYKVDTIYIIDASTKDSRYSIKTTSDNAKMGICLGTGKYEKGEDAEIAAIANYGYHFTQWNDGNTDNPRFVNVTADNTFTAEFEVNNYMVLAEANEKEMGKVEGSAEYAYLSRTQLKATPNTGFKFKEWSDGETANPREILVYSDTSFTAIFEIAETETVTSINESEAQVHIYAHGRTIVVENATDEIRVYNAMGASVVRDAINRVRTEIPINGTGVYIVKTGNTVKRVVVN